MPFEECFDARYGLEMDTSADGVVQRPVAVRDELLGAAAARSTAA